MPCLGVSAPAGRAVMRNRRAAEKARAMLELALLGFWAGLLALGLKRPFLWVMAYIYIDLFAPQRIGWAILPSIPLSLITFAAAFGGWLVLDNKQGSRFTLRQGLILALLLYCALSLLWADFPLEAREKWAWVWKALVFAMFLPLTLTTRLRFEAIVLTFVLAVGVIAIETPVRRRDHAMADFGELERISAYAREQGIRLHLDGARLFTLPLHSGRPVTAYAALFDSVYVSLWKNFNGAGGAILAGSEAFIDGLFHQRRMFGGALPSAWPQVALVEAYANRFEDDYARAWRAADELVGHLEASGRFRARRLPDGSSRFFLSVAGVAPELVAERARGRGLVLAWPHPDTGEFPVQVNPTLLRLPPAELARRLLDSLDG